MNHIMRLKPEPFEQIRSGAKTIELRLLDEKRRKIHVGDTITFVHLENSALTLHTKVTDLFVFDSFETLYQNLPLLACGYTEQNVKTATPQDMDIYYSKEEQTRYGVIGIKIAILEE